MSEHRTAAELALVHGQRNPVMSADQHFAIAHVHALLAIEERLSELAVSLDRAPSPVSV